MPVTRGEYIEQKALVFRYITELLLGIKVDRRAGKGFQQNSLLWYVPETPSDTHLKPSLACLHGANR